MALALAKDQPTDRSFLTDAVLAESNKRAPITEISVSPPDNEYDSSIEASYKMGDQQVNETFTVQKSGENYLLYEVSQDVNLESIRSRTLPLQINGVRCHLRQGQPVPGLVRVDQRQQLHRLRRREMVINSPSDYPTRTTSPS